MSRPRLVHVTTVPDALIFLRDQVGFMKRCGLEVFVVSSPGARLEAFAAREGVEAHAVPMTRRITPARDLVALARLVSTLRRLRPDIVHAHTPKGALLGILASTLLGVRVRIYHLHGLPLSTRDGLRRRLLAGVERVTAGLSTHVLGVSHSLVRMAVDEGLVDPAKIRVLGRGSVNGVDASGRFDPRRTGSEARRSFRSEHGIAERAVVFSFVGRLVRDKGIEDLMQAWQVVSRELPEAHLLLAGEPEAEDPVSPKARAWLERASTVTMLGFVEDTARVYAASDVVVLPTYREGFPNVPLEAAAMGLPVVSTRVVGALDAVLDGSTGTLVAPRDPAALAAAMIAYGRDPELRARHGAAGRRRAEQDFAPEPIWRELFELYRRALGAAEAPQRSAHTTRAADAPHADAAGGT